MIVNRNIPAYLPPDDLAKAAEGDIDADAVRAGLAEGRNHAVRRRTSPACSPRPSSTRPGSRARAESAEQLDEIDVPRLELPALADGVDLGSLYELAEALAQQQERPMSTSTDRRWTWPRSSPTPPTASWCVAAQAVSARPPPPRRWRCAPPSTAAPSWC